MEDGVGTDGGVLTEIREGMDAAREYRRRAELAFNAAVARNPGGKLAKKAAVIFAPFGDFEERRREWGDENDALQFLLAQVASGVSLKVICDHYCLQYGAVIAWFLEVPERHAAYELALKAVADGYYGEIVDIADEAGAYDVAVAGLKIKARDMVAKRYDRARFGDKDAVVAPSGGGFPTSISITFVEADNGRPVERVVSVQGNTGDGG